MTPALVSTNLTDLTVTIAAGGARYEYFFMTRKELETVEYLFQKISPLKGLNYAKGACERCVKQERVA